MKTKSLQELREEWIAEFERLQEACEYDSDLLLELGTEITERQRALLYKACCKYLKNHGYNQFQCAKKFADVAMRDEVAIDSEGYEIGGYFTKDKRPHVVEFC